MHGVAAVVLNRNAELRPLDAERCILGNEHSPLALVDQVQTGRQDSMIHRHRIEDIGETVRGDAVHLDSQRPPTGEIGRRCESAGLGCTQFFKQSDRRTSVGANLVHSRFLPVELLDDDERKHHMVFIESERGMGVGKEDAGIDHVVRGRQSASLSRCVCAGKGCRLVRHIQGPPHPTPRDAVA